MKEREIAYLAGIIDGEGTISFLKRGESYIPQVSIANTSKKLMEWCKTVVGENGTVCRKAPRLPHHSLSYHIRWRFDAALRIAQLCLPYLIIKIDQAKALLKWKSVVRRNGRYGPEELVRRTRLVGKIRALNSRPVRKRTVENSL